MSFSTKITDFDRDSTSFPEITDYITEAAGFHGFLEQATNIHYKGRTYAVVETYDEIEGYIFNDPKIEYVEDGNERPLIIVILHIIALVTLSPLTLIALAIRESKRTWLNMSVFDEAPPVRIPVLP